MKWRSKTEWTNFHDVVVVVVILEVFHAVSDGRNDSTEELEQHYELHHSDEHVYEATLIENFLLYFFVNFV